MEFTPCQAIPLRKLKGVYLSISTHILVIDKDDVFRQNNNEHLLWEEDGIE